MSNDDLHRPVGIWRALGEFKLKEAVWPEGLLALIVGVGGSALILQASQVQERIDAMGDVLALGGAFLAVVFTALALVVSLPSSSYLRMLDGTSAGGMRRFLDPFLIAVGTQILVVLLAVSYRIGANAVPSWAEHLVFGAVGFLFAFGLFDLGSLARQLVRHGILRAADAGAQPDRDQTVRRLPDRRGGQP